MDMEIQPVPWWNRRSRMERRFIWLVGSLLLVSVGLAVGLVGVIYKKDLFSDNSRVEEPSAPLLQIEIEPR